MSRFDGVEKSLAEVTHDGDGIGCGRGFFHARGVQDHLVRVCPGTFVGRLLERSGKLDYGGPQTGQSMAELLDHLLRRRLVAAEVVVKQDVRDVVEVLGCTPPVGGGDLGEEEAGDPGGVDSDRLPHAAALGRELRDDDVIAGDACASKVRRAEKLAVVEPYSPPGGLVVEVGEDLELHEGPVVSLGSPPPHVLLIRSELGVAQRLLEPRGVHRPAGDLQVRLHVDVGRSRVRYLGRAAEKLRDQAT